MSSSIGRASVLRLLRLLATIGLALVIVVIVSSAYLRLSQAGLSCADWPSCYGSLAHAAVVTTAQRGARLAHRFAASAVGIVLIALLAVALAQRPRLARQAMLAAAALAVAVVLAMIGAVTSESARATPLPAVTLANLGGGFALLALLAWLRETLPIGNGDVMPAQSNAAPPATARSPTTRGLRAAAMLALVAVIGQVALGGLVSAKFAALACPSFPLCGADAPAGALLPTLDPFAALDVDATRTIVRPAALATLHAAHRVGAHVVLALVAILAVMLFRSRQRRAALVLAALVAGTLALGAGAVLASLPLRGVLAHNLAAAVLLAALVVVSYRIRAKAG
jgi:cytochrome c oxidase assembly protein subunit 15